MLGILFLLFGGLFIAVIGGLLLISGAGDLTAEKRVEAWALLACGSAVASFMLGGFIAFFRWDRLRVKRYKPTEWPGWKVFSVLALGVWGSAAFLLFFKWYPGWCILASTLAAMLFGYHFWWPSDPRSESGSA